MLPGITGSLIAATFLERVLAEEFSRQEHPRAALARLHQWWRRAARTLGPASSLRAIADAGAIPLFDILGYRLLRLEPHGNGLVGSMTRDGAADVALAVAVWESDPNVAWRDTVRAARPSRARWGFIYTGGSLRLVDAARTWSRRALDVDLLLAMSDERSAIALAALVHAAGERAGSPATLEHLVQRSDSHGADVCRALGQGVLEALAALLSALDTKPNRPHEWAREPLFEQALTIIYRLLFLLFAEARALVPTWHHVYRESYTIDALCRRLTEPRAPVGLWKALQAISRLAHAGCRAGDLNVTPFNGRLFSPLHTPIAERRQVPDAAVGEAIKALATGPARGGRERIAYADLDVEQLGAVYERVLEYAPSRQDGVLRLTRTSFDRKSSGSFYTPRAMTDFLVRRALHPLVADKSADEILRLRVLDPAMGSGAFLVAACRYLSAAVERAAAAEGRGSDSWTPDDRAAVKRTVAQRCLFGVDLNPMAVQLARLSLWLSTLSGDQPLTFLDHHLAAGDSLMGAGFSNLAAPPRIGRATRASGSALPLFDAETAEHFAHDVLPGRLRLAMEPGRTPAEIRAKEQSLADLSAPGTPLQQWKQAADFWCASWFWGAEPLSRGVHVDVVRALTGLSATLPNHQRAGLLERASAIAQQQQFFHWELEFPEVFFGADGRPLPDGGFDAVLGNPPWDVLRADTGDRAARQHARREHSQRLRFFRDSGIYTHQSRGHTNRYQLFLERALQLTRPGGRVALILPAGLASDQGSAALRRHLLDSVAVDRLLGFDNREAIFPIHRDVRFLLVTGTKGGATDRLTCALGHSDAAALDDLPDAAREEPPEARRIVLSRSLLEHWDPKHLSIPLITTRDDLDVLSLVAASIPKLGHAGGWGVTFGRELNATDDRPHFVSRPGGDRTRLLTVVEGKHVEPFRVVADSSAVAIPADRAATLVDPDRTFRRARLAYRDVASATNRVTLIAAVLPPGTISTHTLFCSKTPLGERAQYCLLALLNSLVANYLVRLQVTTHVTTAIMARLPVPKPARSSREFRELAALARVLERTGVGANQSAYARLNAIVARLYGLTRAQYAHVVSTFPLLPQSLRDECLRCHGRATETRRAQR